LSTTEIYERPPLLASGSTRLLDLAGSEARREAFVPVADLSSPAPVDVVELVRLYNTIEEATAQATHPIVQFVSADPGGSNAEAAYTLAWTGATLLGKRVLFVDAGNTKSRWRGPLSLGSDPKKVLVDVALGNAALEETIVTGEEVSLFVATLQHERSGGSAVPAAPQIKAVLEYLRLSFDMIVIAPTPGLDEPLAAILKTIVDGSIIVVDGGRTTARRANRCASLLSSGESLLIGAVMWRRNPIPHLLRRWF
jgi:Mrp family chromosome partitioning ATPase